MMTGLRPKASDSGPVNNVPSPMPSTKLVMISCARFGRSGDRSARDFGIAGSIASMRKGDRREQHRHQGDEFALGQGVSALASWSSAASSSMISLITSTKFGRLRAGDGVLLGHDKGRHAGHALLAARHRGRWMSSMSASAAQQLADHRGVHPGGVGDIGQHFDDRRCRGLRRNRP